VQAAERVAAALAEQGDVMVRSEGRGVRSEE
jgi:hypothetical protein